VKRLAAILVACAYGFVACSQDAEPERTFDDDAATSATAGGVVTMMMTSAGAGGAPTMVTTGQGAGMMTTTTTGPGCVNDSNEPNNTEAAAVALGSIDDCDGSGLSFSGVLADNDVDWYSYEAADVFGCSVDPTRNLSADGQARLCKYFECYVGPAAVTCPAGTQEDTSPQGKPGCCGQGTVAPTLDCTDVISDDATVYLRIDKPSGFSCVNYSATFHY
jgi:hypothetical protein